MNSPRPRNLSDLSQTARRHLPALILPVLVVVAASTAALWLMPGEYRSSAVVFPEQGNHELQVQPDSARMLTAVRQQITSRVRIDKLIETLDLHREGRDKGIHLESAVADIRDRIEVEPGSGQGKADNALTISYRSPNPEIARRITTNIVEQLVAEGVTSTQSKLPAEIEVLRKRATELSSKLREFDGQAPGSFALRETQASAPAATNRGSQPAGEAWRSQMNLESLNDQLYKLGQQIADLNSQIAAQRQFVDAQKKDFSLNNNPTYALLISKRTELQGQRDNLINRQELTDKHPRVLAITDQIAAINNQVEEIRKQQAGTLSQTPEARELLALEADRRGLQLELEVTGREVKRRTTNSRRSPSGPRQTPPKPAQRTAGSSRLQEEYQRLKEDYFSAAAKLQDAQIAAEAGSTKVERLRLLEPASLPQNSQKPNLLLIVLAGAALGLVVGACFVLGLDRRRRKTLQNAHDVEHYTRLSLLAAIPITTTREERRRLKSRSRALLAGGVAVALAATVALTRLLILTEVFDLITSR